MSKDCVLMITHYNRKEGNELFLGSMRFESPKKNKPILDNVMKSFRGPKSLGCCDKEPVGVTATYIKEEQRLEYPPNGYAGFI